MDATHSASFTWFRHAKKAPARPYRLIGSPQTIDIFATAQELTHQRATLDCIEEPVHSDRIKSEFLATVCHELRSPIGAIQNAARALRSPMCVTPLLQQQMCELIERQAQQMAFLVGGLLDITRLGRGPLSLQRQRINLPTILRNAVETLAWDLKERGHRLTVSGPECGVWLMADAARLEQVFVNLLGNASKCTENGGEIDIALRVSAGNATVRIRDSGIGIAPDALPHIFNLFMQAHAAEPRSCSGLGIGLTLVRAIVEAHAGNVAAVSAGVDQGSEFTVRLPLEQKI
jgi:signal transduction histidine kinase